MSTILQQLLASPSAISSSSVRSPGTPGQESEFKISHFKPCSFPSPLATAKFVADSDCILLDPTTSQTEADSSDVNEMSGLQSTIGEQYRRQCKIQLAGPRAKLFYDSSQTTVGMVTCGGVCPGLNNVIRSLVNVLWYRYGVKNIVGFKYGYKGLTGAVPSIKLTPDFVKDIHQFGGTILGTSRGPQDAKVMADYLMSQKVNILFCIGGDGTMKGCHLLANEFLARDAKVSVIGIGKTIDNDLLYLDRSFGFETAVDLSQQAIITAHEEARSTENGIGIVKLMGRESGAIALHASLASGDVNVVLLPEIMFTVKGLVDYLVDRFKIRDHCLIVCAEGAGQQLLGGETGKVDASGNKVFQDIGEFLKKEIATELKKRNVPHSIKYIDPSYSIRAGVTNASDSILCNMYSMFKLMLIN